MTDTGRTDPFADIISLVAGPIAASIRSFDNLRRGAEELMKGFENFNATMANLNETAARVNRLLNDFEEPIRLMLPQITRTVKMADEMATRLSTPIEDVIPGLSRLAQTLDAPVLRTLPTDLSQFVDVFNDLARRMSPLAQMAEQAGGLFGLRMPGFGGSTTPRRAAAPAPAPAAPVDRAAMAPTRTSATRAPATKSPARKAAAKKSPARKSTAKRTTAKKATTGRS
jgi:ABC-type transporter Mla subunit MlaD